MQVVHIGHLWAVLDVEHVDVVEHAAYHLAMGTVVVEQQVFSLDGFGLFESHLGCQLLHLLHHLRLQRCCVPLQDFARLGDVLHILVAADSSYAGCHTVLDVVFQTLLVLACADAFGCYLQAAGAQGIEFLDEFQQVAKRGDMAVGPEVCARPAVNPPCLEDFGQIIVRNADARIGFSVLEQDVVARRPFLDKVVFQQQRILLCLHHYILDVVDFAHQYACLQVLVFLTEIAVHPPSQVFCLSNVDNRAPFVQILVASRAFGQCQCRTLEALNLFFVQMDGLHCGDGVG